MKSSSTTATTDAASARPRHVAVCSFPFASHSGTLLLLSRKIAASDPDAHISFFTTPAAAAALSTSLPPPEEGAAAVHIQHVHDGLSAEESQAGVHLLEALTKFLEAAGESLRSSMAEAEEKAGVKISCLVTDAFLSYVCREIAEEKVVKWVALWTSPAAALAAHMYTDELRSIIGAQGGIEAHKEETLDRYIPGFPPILAGDLQSGIVTGDFSSTFPRMLHNMSHALSSAAVVAMNTIDPLEADVIGILNTRFRTNFIGIGPCSITLSVGATLGGAGDSHGCLPWLDTHLSAPASVVYISFGTRHTPPPEEFTALAEALEASEAAFLWSLPKRFGSYLPDRFEERTSRSGKGKLVSWAPQTLVLDHKAVGAQLTHCGWNSVLESIVSGVPMICRPMTIAEQLLNKRLVVSVWGIGVELEGGKLTKEAAGRALERVLLEEEGRTARAKICGMTRLVDEAVAEPDGSSTRNLQEFITTIVTG